MARLPTVLDYGQRPSLRSTRVDRPDESGLMIADSIEKAASTFTQIAGEVKQKNDRLNYSLAKNELMQGDIEARDKIKDSEDYEKYDDIYTGAYQAKADDVFSSYELSPSDRALLEAESDLIRARGRAYISEESGRTRIDWQRSRIMDDLDRAREAVLNTKDAMLQNDLMQAQLESITSAMNDGVLGAAEGQKLLQDWVTSVATGSLEQMSAEDRIKELELSLARRDARGPISPEDLAQGRGSGSIADYLHRDVATEMLEAAKKEQQLETEYEVAYGIIDSVLEEEPLSRSAGMALAREKSKGLDAKTRWRVEQLANARYSEVETAEREQATSMMRSAATLMREGFENGKPFTYNDLPADQLRILTPEQDSLLRRYSEALLNGQQFGGKDTYAKPKGWQDSKGNLIAGSFEYWGDLSEAEKAAEDLFDPAWRLQFTESGWNRMWNEQRDIRARVDRGVGAGSHDNVQTNDQIVASVVPQLTNIPATGRSDSENEIYQRIRAKHADLVAEEQRTKYDGKKAPYHRRKEILLQMLAEEAYVRRYDFGLDWLDSDEAVKVFEVKKKDIGEAYIPLRTWENKMTTDKVGDQEVDITWKQKLINMSRSELDGRDPSPEDLESAFYAIRAGMPRSEVLRRLGGGR